MKEDKSMVSFSHDDAYVIQINDWLLSTHTFIFLSLQCLCGDMRSMTILSRTVLCIIIIVVIVVCVECVGIVVVIATT